MQGFGTYFLDEGVSVYGALRSWPHITDHHFGAMSKALDKAMDDVLGSNMNSSTGGMYARILLLPS